MMKPISVLADNNIVNRISDMAEERPGDKRYEEDRLYLSKIMEDYVKTGTVQLFVNPSVEREIRNTKDPQRKDKLLAVFEQCKFTSCNKTVFTFRFPVHFVTTGEEAMLQRLEACMPGGFKKDIKIFLDALANPEIDVLLTTDRDDLAKRKLCDLLANEGLNKKIKILTPKELYEYLQ